MNFFKCFFILFLLLIPAISAAAGFRIGEQGAAAMGKANAVTASINDVTAVFFNPAALTSLKGSWISAGGTLISPSTDYKNTIGLESSKEPQIFYPPNFYAGTYLKDKKIALGLGIYAPFGLGSKWSDTGPFRYEATYTDLKVFNINPTIAYKINPVVSIGGGINYQKLFVTYDKQNPWSAFGGTTDGKAHLTGEGSGLGYNFGILFSPTEKFQIGIAYRSRIQIDINGYLELSNINGASPLSTFGSSQFKSDVSLPLDLPDILFFGIAYKLFDRLTVEFDFDWTGWSSFKQLKFDYADEKPPFLTDTITKKNWRNVLAFRAGLEYSFNDNLKARAGYAYDPNPVPEDTFEPRITDSNRHQLTIGNGYTFGRFIVDLAYMAVFFEKRNITNNEIDTPSMDVNGTYKSFSHLVGANISYNF